MPKKSLRKGSKKSSKKSKSRKMSRKQSKKQSKKGSKKQWDGDCVCNGCKKSKKNCMKFIPSGDGQHCGNKLCGHPKDVHTC